MILQAESSKLLANWLELTTWHTEHHADWDRWYDFVDQYQRDHGNTIDEVALRDHIAHEAKCDGDEEFAQIIAKRISVMYHILDFLWLTGR
jgi:hypothetical protein